MKNILPLRNTCLAVFAAALGLGVCEPLQAQVQVAEVGDFDIDDLPSPDLGGYNTKKFRPKDWLEIEASMSIPAQNREQKEAGFIDRILVKWYVAVKDKKTGKMVLLTKDIPHINIQVDEDFYTSVYLSPNTILRLTGSDRASKSEIEAVAVEVLINGVKVGEQTEGEKRGWWNAPSLARGDKYPLLNKNETPFKVYWWDRYAEIEEER